MALSSEEVAASEAKAQEAVEALQAEQAKRQGQVQQFNSLIAAKKPNGIGVLRPKRASRFD